MGPAGIDCGRGRLSYELACDPASFPSVPAGKMAMESAGNDSSGTAGPCGNTCPGNTAKSDTGEPYRISNPPEHPGIHEGRTASVQDFGVHPERKPKQGTLAEDGVFSSVCSAGGRHLEKPDKETCPVYPGLSANPDQPEPECNRRRS